VRHPVEQLGWLVIGLLLGGLLAITVNWAVAETNTISSTVSSTVTSSSNTVSSGTNTIKGASTASAPAISITNSDICKYAGMSGGVQTQVFGITTGGVVVEDMNCERIKLARTVANTLALKTVAASIMAEDPRVFRAMWRSNVIPPIAGKLGAEARQLWIDNPDKLPDGVTLEDLLLSDEYLELKEAIARDTPAEELALPNVKTIDGHKVCKAEGGNYYMSC